MDDIEILSVHGTIWNGMRGRKVRLVIDAMGRRGYDLVASDSSRRDADTLVFARPTPTARPTLTPQLLTTA
jgi:hypothetical protein